LDHSIKMSIIFCFNICSDAYFRYVLQLRKYKTFMESAVFNKKIYKALMFLSMVVILEIFEYTSK
jgi:hypothetical protein